MASQSDTEKFEIAQVLAQVAIKGEKLIKGKDGARERLVASARDLLFAAEDTEISISGKSR
jgi:hypothetical protein